MNLKAQHDCGLSKAVQAATISTVATNSSNSGTSRPGGSRLGNPGQLRQTLTDLESALTSWDKIVPDPTTPEASTRARTTGASLEMKQRTRELLNQLKEQIDELSSEENQA